MARTWASSCIGLGRVVDPDDPLAGRPGDGLHHTRKADLGRRGSDLSPGGDDPEAGLGKGRGRQALPHDRLVPGTGDGAGRTVPEAQLLGGQGGDDHTLVVDGQDGVERGSVVQEHDGGHSRGGVTHGHDKGPVAHGATERLAVLGADHDVDAEAPGGGEKIRCPVGGRGEQQEDPGHPPILAATGNAEARAP